MALTFDDGPSGKFTRNLLDGLALRGVKATFLLSNVVPQSPSVNRGDWKRYEDATRRYATGGHPLHIEVDCLWFNADTTYIGIHRLAVLVGRLSA